MIVIKTKETRAKFWYTLLVTEFLCVLRLCRKTNAVAIHMIRLDSEQNSAIVKIGCTMKNIVPDFSGGDDQKGIKEIEMPNTTIV
jgi:hypothetical protein